MGTKRATARIGTVVLTVTIAGVMAGGTALAAGLGTDTGLPGPAAAVSADAVTLPAPVATPTPSPSPSTDPVGTVTTTVNGLLDTVKDTLGVNPAPSASPSPTTTATPTTPPLPRPQPRPVPGPGTQPATTPVLPHTGGVGGTVSTGPLSGFGSTLGDRRPALADLAGPSRESVHGIGAIAAPALPRSVADALPSDGTAPNSLPGLLVVCAAACVAAVAAGNAEVWRRRLAERLA